MGAHVMSNTIPSLPPMQRSPVGASRGRGIQKTVGWSILILIFLGLMALMGWTMASRGLTDLSLMGSPLHVPAPGGGKVYYITGQWRTYFATRGRHVTTQTSTTNLFVDLWAINAADAKPLWRRRISSERNGSMDGHSILGAHGDALWLLIRGQPTAVSLVTGDPLLKRGQLEERNQTLRGLLPTEERFYEFDSHGLRFTALDGRAWRVSKDFVAAVEAAKPEGTGDAQTPAYFTPYASYMFQIRALDIPGAWLGVLTDEEKESFDEKNTVGGLNRELRYRLWRAKAGKATNFFGDMTVYDDFVPLAESTEFLGGGLLYDYKSGVDTPAIWLREPDSVLVLHREHLGHLGKLRLTRVAGPEGTIVWDITLPMTILQSVMRDEKSLLLFGKENFPDPPGAPRTDPTRDAPERLLAVDLATGAVQMHDHTATAVHLAPVDVSLAP